MDLNQIFIFVIVFFCAAPVLYFGGVFLIRKRRRQKANAAFRAALMPAITQCKKSGVTAPSYQPAFTTHMQAADTFKCQLPKSDREAFEKALEAYKSWMLKASESAQADQEYGFEDTATPRVKKINPSVHLNRLLQFAA